MSFKSTFSSLLIAASLAPFVAAHGWVGEVRIAGRRHGGLAPGQGRDFETPIRQISTSFPINGATKREMNCGPEGKTEDFSAQANPGEQIEFQWTSNEGKWPHNTGPMITYMTPCGERGCQEFDPIDAEWFKIDEQGRDPARNDGLWVQNQLFEFNQPARVTLPSNLPGGEYLVRHEVIGLHLGQNFQGAEFYPSCLAINLSAPSNGISSIPTGGSGETARFPGGYSDNDPGILGNPFDQGREYIFPGPPVINFATRSLSPAPAPAPETPPANNNNGPILCTQPSQKKRSTPANARRSPEVGGLHDGVAEYLKARGAQPEYFAAKMPVKRSAEPEREYRPRQISRIMKALV